MRPVIKVSTAVRARVDAWLAQLAWTATALVRYVQSLG